MAKIDLGEYFRGGSWKDEYGDLEESALDAELDIPAHALKVIWEAKLFRSKLETSFGVSPAKWQQPARKGIERLMANLQAAGKLNEHEAALGRLVVESLIVVGGKNIFPIYDENKRRQWVRSMAAEDFGVIKSLSPSVVLRLATTKSALTQASPECRTAVARCIKGALATLRSGEPVGDDAQIRIAAIRCWVKADEGDDADEELNQLLKDAGLDRRRMESLITDIRESRSIEGLFAPAVTPCNMEALFLNGDFKESADFYGYSFDVERYREGRELEQQMLALRDPWCRQLVVTALHSGERSSNARVQIRSLGADGALRWKTMDVMLAERLLTMVESRRIIDAEFAQAGTRIEQRVFRACCIARFEMPQTRFREMLNATGFGAWFDQSFDAYRRSADGAIASEFSQDFSRSFQTVGEAVKKFPLLAELAEDLREIGVRFGNEVERGEAARSGRGWLVDYILQCQGLDVEQLDGGRGILTESDRERVLSMIRARIKNAPRWWAQPLGRPTEMRLCEASVRDFGGGAERLTELAQETADEIFHSVPGTLRGLGKPEIEACANFVITGSLSPRSRLLEAFRAGDAAEFICALEGEEIELPVASSARVPRVFGRRVAMMCLMIALFPAILFGRLLFASAPPHPTANEPPMPDLAPSFLDPTRETAWIPLDNPLGGGRHENVNAWMLVIDRQRLAEVIGVNSGGDDNDKDDVPLLAKSMAGEFQRRFALSLKQRYPLGFQRVGLNSPTPWDSFSIGLPDREQIVRVNDALVATKARDSSKPFWMEDLKFVAGSAEPADVQNPFMRGAIYVIVRYR